MKKMILLFAFTGLFIVPAMSQVTLAEFLRTDDEIEILATMFDIKPDSIQFYELDYRQMICEELRQKGYAPTSLCGWSRIPLNLNLKTGEILERSPRILRKDNEQTVFHHTIED